MFNSKGIMQFLTFALWKHDVFTLDTRPHLCHLLLMILTVYQEINILMFRPRWQRCLFLLIHIIVNKDFPFIERMVCLKCVVVSYPSILHLPLNLELVPIFNSKARVLTLHQSFFFPITSFLPIGLLCLLCIWKWDLHM